MLIGPSLIDDLASIHRRETDVLNRLDRLSHGLKPKPKTVISGVYHLYDGHHKLIYIGESYDIYKRMDEHQSDWLHQIWDHEATFVSLVVIIDQKQRRANEKFLIKLYQPICNIQHNPQKKIPLMSQIGVHRPNPLARGLLASGPTAPKLSELGTDACLGNLIPGADTPPLKRPLMGKSIRTGLGNLRSY